MPLGNEIGKYIWAIAEQKKGFTFGKTWQNSDSASGLVVPILRQTQVKRTYIMLEETKKVQISDTGAIGSARVKSDDDTNVFIRSGIILAGSTQERATVAGVVVLPHSELELEVKCVHASKGIHSGAVYDLNKTEVVPPMIHFCLSAQCTSNEKQSRVWNSVQDYCHGSGKTHIIDSYLGVTDLETPSDDLYGTLKEIERRKKHIEDALKDIPLLKNQVGALIFDNKGVVGFEVFDSPKSWAAMHHKVLPKYGDVLTQKTEGSSVQLNAEHILRKIQGFIEEIMAASEKQTHATKESTTCVIDSAKVIGEYTQIHDVIIHVLAFKRQQDLNPRPRNRPRESSMREIILKTDDIAEEHIGKNKALVDGQTRDALDVRAGDIIEIEGGKRTSAIVGDAHPDEEGHKSISIDWVTVQNAGVIFGKQVTVRRAEVRPAKEIAVAVPADETRRYRFRDHAKSQIQKDLLHRCVMKDDLVLLHDVSSANFFRRYRTEPLLKIIDTAPSGVVRIDDSTKVHFTEETVVNTDIWIGDERRSSDA